MRINREYKVIKLDETKFKHNSLAAKKIVVTGTLVYFSRSDIEIAINNLGGKMTGSVSKTIDFIVVGKDAGSKLQKAKELGVQILTEEDFLDLILE